MPKPKAIFFDIDNTLFPTDAFAALARRSAVKAMVKAGLPFSEKETYDALMGIVRKYGSNYPLHFDRLLDSLGAGRDPKLIASAVIAYHSSKRRLAPYPGVKHALRTLKARGFKLYIFSRGIAVKQWDKLIRIGLHNLFTNVFVTDAKTTHSYRGVMHELRLAPGEALMVGDNPDIDVIPARKAGLLTAHLMKGKHAKDAGSRLADFRIREISELPALVERISRRRMR